MFSVEKLDGGDDAEHGQAEAEMGDGGRPGGARQAGKAPPGCRRDGMRPILARSTRSAMAPNSTQNPRKKPIGASETSAPDSMKTSTVTTSAATTASARRLAHRDQIAALPGHERPEGQNDQQRRHQDREGQVEERRADRDAPCRSGHRARADRACRPAPPPSPWPGTDC